MSCRVCAILVPRKARVKRIFAALLQILPLPFENPMKLSSIAIAAAMMCGSVAASAGVTSVGDRTTFNALGSIAFNSNFASFGASFGYPDNPFTLGDVTYTSAENLTVGKGSGYSIGDYQTVMSNNYWSPLTGTIASTTPYSLFGFDAAVTSGPVSITVDTNQGSYSFAGLSLPNGSSASQFAFKGFRTTGTGEYFTGFRIVTLGGGYLPGITNVAVGVISAVPEPEAFAMMLAGLGLIGTIARRRKSKQA